MRITCWIPKAKNTHSEYVIYITFLLQKWLHESTSILHYTEPASLVYIGSKLKRVLSFMFRLFCRLRDALGKRLGGPRSHSPRFVRSSPVCRVLKCLKWEGLQNVGWKILDIYIYIHVCNNIDGKQCQSMNFNQD